VAAFDQVRLEGLGRLVFDASIPAGTVKVTADARLMSRVKTTVEGSTLVLREEGFQGPGSFRLEFQVAPPASLTRVSLGGVGEISATGPLKAHDLTLALDGLGKIDLAVTADTLSARQQGQGELSVSGTATKVQVRADGLGKVDLSSLAAQSVDVESNGLGEVSVRAAANLKVRANGLGAVHFYGHPPVTDVQTKGLTQVSAAD
jgi:hypothetical protein